MDEIIKLIQSVGFPIVAYLLLFFYTKSESKTTRDAIMELKLAVVEQTAMLQKFYNGKG